jgi:hypothetical protein
MCNLIIFQINTVHSKEKARALFCEPSVNLECPTDIWGGAGGHITWVGNAAPSLPYFLGSRNAEEEGAICNLLKNNLTPEDGQFRPKHVVVLKDFKVTSVENTIKCFKH